MSSRRHTRVVGIVLIDLSYAPVDGTLSSAFSHASSASASRRTTGNTKGDAMIRPGLRASSARGSLQVETCSVDVTFDRATIAS